MRANPSLRAVVGICVLLAGSLAARGASSEYDVSVEARAGRPQAQPAFQAENPANGLQLEFGADGVQARSIGGQPWSFQLTPRSITFGPAAHPFSAPRMTASGNQVTYDFDQARLSYTNTKDGLIQVLTIPAPPGIEAVQHEPEWGEEEDEHEGHAEATAITVNLELAGDLKLSKAAYYVDLLGRDGKVALRYGAFRATDAHGKTLEGGIEVRRGIDGKALGTKIVVGGVDLAYPITVQMTLRVKQSAGVATGPAAVTEPSGDIVGQPVELGMGITETVDQIMERAKLAPKQAPAVRVKREYEFEPKKVTNPDAPNVSQWPPPKPDADFSEPVLFSPQTVGTTFRAIILYDNATATFDAPAVPPDSMGDVGPTQILAATNGRIKVFDKTGTLGPLNVPDATFWAPLAPSGGASDPEVRYDRLSARWFVLAIDLATTNNKIMLAVSSGPTITGAASFTFFSFTSSVMGDGANFCDYPSMGIDANAIYGGCNMFTALGAFSRTSAYVIRKSSVLGAGPIVVTGFGGIATGAVAGPFAPQGVDNDDPTWTQGYIIGVDTLAFSTLQIRRVSNPGGTPTLSGNLSVTVPMTTNMVRQWAPGTLNNASRIDASDDRVYKGSIHKNKLTGVTSLWVAQSVEVSPVGTPLNTGTTNDSKRIGARWYEIGNLTGTPSLTQGGTLFSTTPGATTYNSERGYLFPSVAETGQGHMALGASYGSTTEFMGAATSGRLRTDAPGSTQAATVAFAGTDPYRLCDGSSMGACPRNRWGDYSFTDVDPNDDQTVWTFQEYTTTPVTLNIGTGNWAVRAIQLRAPPPALPSSISPSTLCQGLPSTNVTITGTSSSGSEFFDPGSDPVPYANRIGVAVTGGVTTVGQPAIVIPGSPTTTAVTQVTAVLNTTGATTGAKNVTVTNPDGQALTGTGLLTIVSVPSAPTASSDGPICAGAALNLSASTVAGATYSWTGPNGFASSAQNPSIANATTAASGTYNVTVSLGGCTSSAGSTLASVIATSAACGDPTATTCNAPDTCGAGGVCQANFAGAGTICGLAGTACKIQDTCDGSGACVDNGFESASTLCSGASQGGACDNDAADHCTGTSAACVDVFQSSGFTCRASAGDCDAAETCSGASAACPADGFQPSGTACGDPSSGACDGADTCDGSGACRVNHVADGTNCGDAGTACVNQDACLAGACNDNGFQPSGTACGDPGGGACDNADTCDGSGACRDNHVVDGTLCGDAGTACTNQDLCLGGSCQDNGFQPLGTACGDPSSSVCDTADTCNGSGGCATNHVADGTSCNDADATTCSDACAAGACAGTPTAEPTEINASVRFGNDKATLFWFDPPGTYNVYRGSNGSGGWSYGQTCFSPNQVPQAVGDAAKPPIGTFFYYLVSRVNVCRESVIGRDSSATPDPNTSPCVIP